MTTSEFPNFESGDKVERLFPKSIDPRDDRRIEIFIDWGKCDHLQDGKCSGIFKCPGKIVTNFQIPTCIHSDSGWLYKLHKRETSGILFSCKKKFINLNTNN